MKRLEPVALTAVLALLAGAPRADADAVKGRFHYGKVIFTPSDALAFQVDGRLAGTTATMVALTDFKIDRVAVMEAIDTPSAIVDQVYKAQRGNVVFVSLLDAGRCGVNAFLGETAHSVGLGDGFTLKPRAAPGARVAGDCATAAPGRMFDDEYDFALTWDVPLTVIPGPTPLAAGGEEPGAAYLALVKAIRARDFGVAKRHLTAEQVPERPPSDLKQYFHAIGLNYPKAATIVGGLVKAGVARIEIQGIDQDGKKIRGVVNMRKAGADWRVVDQSLFFME